jgi:hypothetical protein
MAVLSDISCNSHHAMHPFRFHAKTTDASGTQATTSRQSSALQSFKIFKQNFFSFKFGFPWGSKLALRSHVYDTVHFFIPKCFVNTA